uniref:Glutathione peroxidase n=1 Tax=Setaria digitata TaxID=48799 RepID=A0A915PEE3_9BILA
MFAVILILTYAVLEHSIAAHVGSEDDNKSAKMTRCKLTNQSVYDFQVQTLDDSETNLTKYRNRVILLVNVATYCGYTYQYNDFNPLLESNPNGTLVILAFPCNQFYLQEPAENHELLNGLKYVRPGHGWKPHNNMHIFGKLEVNGENNHPLYEFLKKYCPQTVPVIGKRHELMYNPIGVNDIVWNFEKFLIDKKGRPRYRFHPAAWIHGSVVQPFINELENET